MSTYLFDFVKDDDTSDWCIIRADDYISALDFFQNSIEYKDIVHVFVRLW